MGSRNGHHLQPGGEDVSETGEAHARGSLMTKVVPAPGWLSQRIVPPCACKIWRETASPKPVPPSLVEKNGSKNPSFPSPLIPPPESEETTSAPPPAGRGGAARLGSGERRGG